MCERMNYKQVGHAVFIEEKTEGGGGWLDSNFGLF